VLTVVPDGKAPAGMEIEVATPSALPVIVTGAVSDVVTVVTVPVPGAVPTVITFEGAAE
jgi:hypothetical protein